MLASKPRGAIEEVRTEARVAESGLIEGGREVEGREGTEGHPSDPFQIKVQEANVDKREAAIVAFRIETAAREAKGGSAEGVSMMKDLTRVPFLTSGFIRTIRGFPPL